MDQRQYLGVSELGMCQARVWWAHQKNVQPEVSEESMRVMELGHLVEALRRREVRKQEGIRIYGPQQEVNFFEAIGHIDGWVKLPEGEVALWEAKSTTGYSISKWRQDALPRHFSWQLHGYLHGLSQFLGKEVSLARLDVIDRVKRRSLGVALPEGRKSHGAGSGTGFVPLPGPGRRDLSRT